MADGLLGVRAHVDLRPAGAQAPLHDLEAEAHVTCAGSLRCAPLPSPGRFKRVGLYACMDDYTVIVDWWRVLTCAAFCLRW